MGLLQVQAKQVLAMVYPLLLWPPVTSMQGKEMVSGRSSYFEKRSYGLHVSQGFTQPHFSLSEEARNTEHRSWNSDLKLRHSHVAFISAGTSTAEDLNPVIQKSGTGGEATESSSLEKSRAHVKALEKLSTAHTVVQMSNMTLNESQSNTTPQTGLEVGLDSMSKRNNVDSGLQRAEASNETLLIDLQCADKLLHADPLTRIMRRSPSPTGSDSSGEVIIFAGRRQSYNKGEQKYTSDAQLNTLNAQNVSKPSKSHSSMATMIDDPIKVTAQSIRISRKNRSSSFSPTIAESAPDYLSCHSGVNVTKFGRRRRRKYPMKEMKDEGISDDYVVNIRDGGTLEALVESSMLNEHGLGDSGTAEWQGEVKSLTTECVERDSIMTFEEWDSADLEDFNELSTSDEGLESIDQVLSKRERSSGVQYLVVGAGCTVNEARWFPVSALNIAGVEALIQEFENNAELDHVLNGSLVSDASLTIDEQVARDFQKDAHDREDEKDLRKWRKARMTDEQVARLLSKQEELGLGSDDLMLYDGGDVATDSQETFQLDGPWEREASHRASSKPKRWNRSRSDFPSATAFADVLDQDPYNGFDVMDQQRPSLHKRLKGRRGKRSMELSDSELEQSILTAWENDRTKKKMRKQDREELRAQGLLGKKNKIDLNAKYSQGISMAEVKKEIRDFLVSSMDRYVSPASGLIIINIHRDPVCRFHQCLRNNAKWCTKLPMSSG